MQREEQVVKQEEEERKKKAMLERGLQPHSELHDDMFWHFSLKYRLV